MDDLPFYVLFNSISVVLGRQVAVCNGTPFTLFRQQFLSFRSTGTFSFLSAIFTKGEKSYV